MKRIAIFFLALISFPSAAQQWYAGLGSGLGFPIAGSVIIENNYRDSTHSEWKSTSGSYGAGWNFSFYSGYRFANALGLELQANYLNGNSYTAHSEYYIPNYFQTSQTRTQVREFRIIPSVRYEAGAKKLRLYMRAGLLIGAWHHQQVEGHYTYIQTEESSRLDYGGVSLGVSCGTGLSYAIGNHFSLFAECTAVGESWSPAKGKITKYEINGSDQLNSLPMGTREFVYVDEPAFNAYMNTDQPGQAQRMSIPMSAVGFAAGVQFSFSGKMQQQ